MGKTAEAKRFAEMNNLFQRIPPLKYQKTHQIISTTRKHVPSLPK